MNQTVLLPHPLESCLSLLGNWKPKARARTLLRALFCTAAMALSALWSYGQMPALQNLEFGNDVRGYSIERADPNNPQSGYVMAGSWIGGTAGNLTCDQAHFVVTDAAGIVLTSVIIGDPIIELKPVDVAVSLNNTYYVTCAGRRFDPNTGAYYNSFVVVLEMDLSGNVVNQLLVNPIFQVSVEKDYFPMHSVVDNNGYLYICGWADNPSGTYPFTPTAGGLGKVGFVLKVDMNGQSVPTKYFWNTTAPGGTLDFDMATRLRLAANGTDLLVTGARNSTHQFPGPQYPSYPLALRFDLATLTPQANTGFSPNNALTGEDRYGIDIWEDPAGETYVLFNEDIGGVKRWGVGALNALTGLPVSNLGNIQTYGGIDFWANQMLPSQGSVNNVKVVGQQVSTGSCGGSSNPANPSNVQAFVAELSVSYNAVTDQLSTGLGQHQTQQLQFGAGTFAPTNAVDYLTQGGFSADASRYYTLAVGDDPAIGIQDITLATPVAGLATNNLLNVKLDRLDMMGFQQACPQSTYQDCPTGPQLNIPVAGSSSFGPTVPDYNVGVPQFSSVATGYNQYDCSVDFRAASASGPGSAADQPLAVSPNPAAQAIRVKLDGGFAGKEAVSVRLYNLQGQQVAVWQRRGGQLQTETLELPQLSPGLYRMVAEADGLAPKTAKLVVQ